MPLSQSIGSKGSSPSSRQSLQQSIGSRGSSPSLRQSLPQSLESRESIPTEVSSDYNNEILYHIILDCDFASLHKNKNSDNTHQVFGKIRELIKNDQIPVLYDFDQAKTVAKRLVELVMKKGTSANKKYPILGAIISGIRLNLSKTDVLEIQDPDASRHYDRLLNNTNEFSTYTINGVKRGVVREDTFQNATVVSAYYQVESDIDPHVAFALHNLNHTLSEKDVRMMKKIYKKSLKTNAPVEFKTK